jgi:hypothetical protein
MIIGTICCRVQKAQTSGLSTITPRKKSRPEQLLLASKDIVTSTGVGVSEGDPAAFGARVG